MLGMVYVTSAGQAALHWSLAIHGQAEAANPSSCCRHTYQSDSSLVISHVKLEDAGTYSCHISDGRTESRQIRLHIIGDLSSST